MKDLIPFTGNKRAGEAWDEVFSRDVLGSVILGSATGKFVEYIIALIVWYFLGPNAQQVWEIIGYLVSWGVAIPVGIWIFVYWHKIEKTAEEAAETAYGVTD